MFYTELDPYTLEKVYVAKTPHEKALQRALLQYFNPKNKSLVIEALKRAGRSDLIGMGDKCLVRPEISRGLAGQYNKKNTSNKGKSSSSYNRRATQRNRKK